MNRDLAFSRKYFLGNYQTVDIGDRFLEVPVSINIPGELAFNQQLVEKLGYLEMVTVETLFRRYMELQRNAGTFTLEKLAQSLTYLEEEKEKTLAEVKEILNNRSE